MSASSNNEPDDIDEREKDEKAADDGEEWEIMSGKVKFKWINTFAW